MKRIFPLMFAALIVVSVLLQGCKKEAEESSISNFDIHEVLKSASRNFEVTLEGDTFYLSIVTSIQWPLQFGASNLEPLRDSLLTRMYRVAPGTAVDDAIMSFIDNDTVFGSEARMRQVDSVPSNQAGSVYEIDYSAKLMELTERTVTYQIVNSSYLGGAHPNYASYPFTYDLVNACMLTPENMFKGGTTQHLLGLIKKALATQEGVSVARLASADIFVDDLFVSPMIYLSNGGVVFHYNPYEIAPYYKGVIDVEIPSFVLEPYLTARADSLLNQ